MTNQTAVTVEELEAFRLALDEAAKADPTMQQLIAKIPGYYQGYSFTVGKKNAKFVQWSGGQGSCNLFVDMATGDILKSAGQVPAKGARGNIRTTKPQAGTRWLYR